MKRSINVLELLRSNVKQIYKDVLKNITYNFKTLLYFEIIYRLLGVFIIFPIAKLLLLLSIRISGFVYITNELLFTYLEKPSTIVILLILLVILGVYLVLEMIFLSLLYDYSYHNIEINLREFLLIGIKKVIYTIKRYHIFIIIPALIFFLLVEFLHIVGIVSTISIPDFVHEELVKHPLLQGIYFIIGILIILFFIETIFILPLFSIDKRSLHKAFKESRKFIKKRRIIMLFEFLIINIFINLILYGIYLLIIVIVSGLIFITLGQELVLGFLLTILYALYLIIGFMGTIILIPINYSLVSAWYYKTKERLGYVKKTIYLKNNYKKIFKFKFFKKGLIISIIVIFVINITSVIATIRRSNIQIELFRLPDIIAHRGSSLDAPENTLASIEYAIIQGADVVEIDVRETLDFVPILLHDTTLGRTTNDKFNNQVSLVTLQYIKTLDAGSWFSPVYKNEKIPTLEEALKLIDGRCKIFIELKSNSTSLCDSVVKLIEKYKIENDVKVLSNKNSTLSYIKQINPKIETVLLVLTFYGDINNLIANNEINHYAFEKSIIINNPEYVDIVHLSQKQLYVFTLNDEERVNIIVENGVDGIITDRPIEVREIVYSTDKKTIFSNILKELFKRKNEKKLLY